MRENQPSAALLALAARWWADFADRVERAVSEWNSRSESPTAVTFTHQSQREISIAHRWYRRSCASRRTAFVSLLAAPSRFRNNLGAATLVDFRESADGLIALVDGRPMSIDGIVERVVGPIVRHEPTK